VNQPTVVGTRGAVGAPMGRWGGAARRASPPVAVEALYLGAGGGAEEAGRIAGAGACKTQPLNFASSPFWAAGRASLGAPLRGAEPNLSCCPAHVLSDR